MICRSTAPLLLLCCILSPVARAAVPPEAAPAAASETASGTASERTWDPPADTAELFNAGVLALGAGQPAQAEAAFQEILRLEPDCGRCAHGLGLALVRQQRLDQALSVLSAAAKTWPQHAELQTALAGALFATQDFEAALKHASTAALLDPTSVDAQVALSQVLLRLGRTDQARLSLAAATLPGPERACLETLILIEEGGTAGGMPLAYCRQAKHPGLASTVDSRVAAGAGRLSATAAAAQRDGATTVQQVASALRLHQRGRDAQALPLLNAALQQEERRIDARILRALVRARTGDNDGALADLQHVFDADSWVQVHATGEMSGVLTASDQIDLEHSVQQGAGLLVSLLVHAGRLDDAQAALDRATGRLGRGPELTAGAVRLADARDHRADAWAQLEAGLEQWPDDADLVLLASELAAAQTTAQTTAQTGDESIPVPPSGVPASDIPPSIAARLRATTDWRARYHLAVGQERQGQHAECARLAGQAATDMAAAQPGPTPDDRVTVRRLWHTCAVNAELHAEAERAATALGSPDRMNEVARINHALLRLQSGDHAGALDLLSGIVPTTPARSDLVAAIRDQAGASAEIKEAGENGAG